MNRAVAIIGVAFLLGGCSSIPESTCRTPDWYGLGFRDAMKGMPERSSRLKDACSGYAVNASDYLQGWESGLDEFCSSDHAYEFGTRGGKYQGTCPGALHTIFLHAYERGLVVAELERRIAGIDRQLDEIERMLSSPSLQSSEYYYWRNRASELLQERRGYEQQLARQRRY